MRPVSLLLRLMPVLPDRPLTNARSQLTCARKELTCVRKELTCVRKELTCVGKELFFAGKELTFPVYEFVFLNLDLTIDIPELILRHKSVAKANRTRNISKQPSA